MDIDDMDMQDSNSNEEERFPLHQFQLSTTPNDFNTLTIISFIESQVFQIPLFQRHYVWDIKRASRLIESLLIGLPIPQIFLYERDKNKFLVIDGQQRLMSIYYFFNGRFPRKEKRSELRTVFDKHGFIPKEVMADDEFFQKFNLRLDRAPDGPKNQFDGKNYGTLGEGKTTLNLATIRNMVIKPIQGDHEDGAMFEIFNRLNSGGMNLGTQEIRMSLYHSDFLISLIQLNNHIQWRKILGKNEVDLRLNDVESILRALAMSLHSDKYTNSISGFLNTFSNHAKKYKEQQVRFIDDLWSAFMDATKDLEEAHFRTGANRLSITLFESVFFAACTESIESKIINVKKISPKFMDILKSDLNYIKYSTDKTTSKVNVLGRLQRAKELFES